LRDFGFKKKKLVVCGESFSYGNEKHHWPSIVANELNLELINLSIVGCSNFAICFQIEHALKSLKHEDTVIISLTAAERFEIDDDDLNRPARLEDFRQNIDEIKHSTFKKTPTITSGNLASHLRNCNIERMKKYLISSSYRLNAQYQAWALLHLLNLLPCMYILYRNIYPRFHKNIEEYCNEHYFGLESVMINSGPHDYEKECINSTNHLSEKENKIFASRVIRDINERCV
jgi:hypothetical protein